MHPLSVLNTLLWMHKQLSCERELFISAEVSQTHHKLCPLECMVSNKDCISPSRGFLALPDPSRPLLICLSCFSSAPTLLISHLFSTPMIPLFICPVLPNHVPPVSYPHSLTPFLALSSLCFLCICPPLNLFFSSACYYLHSLSSPLLLHSFSLLLSFVLFPLLIFFPHLFHTIVLGCAKMCFS